MSVVSMPSRIQGILDSLTCQGYVFFSLTFLFYLLIITVSSFLLQAMVRIKALQDRCVAKEGVIRRYCKRQEYETKERDQYKEVVRTLNTELMVKLALLKKETRRHEELEKANTNLKMELAAFGEQMEKAQADAVAWFWTS